MSLPQEGGSRASWLPDTSHGFWRFCLLASLVVNLVVAGLVIGRVWHHGPPPGPQANFQQFVPGRFFASLEGPRRRELGEMLRGFKPQFEEMRQKNGLLALQVADELEKADFDAAKLAAMIDSVTTGPDSMAARAATLLKDFYGKLTPDERKAMAKAIRDRHARKD